MKPRILASSLRKTFFNLESAREYQSYLNGKGIMTEIYEGYNEGLKAKTFTVDLPRKEV